MKAIGYQTAGAITAPNALENITLAEPTATGFDLLVEIKAISVNPVDTKIRASSSAPAGEYKIIGWDAVGVVKAVGEKVSLFNVGDEVWYAGDISRSGSYAEYQLVDERIVGHKPKSLTYTQAAALPLTGITAWEILFDRLALPQDGSATDARILIIGAAGGVGSIITQLAVKLTGAEVIGTASRPESAAWVHKLGADAVIDHTKPLSQELANIGITNVTHVISLTQTDQHFDEIVQVLKPQGKLALIDDPKGPLDVMKLKRKSLSLHWELMFTRSLYQTEDMIAQHHLLNRLSALIDTGELQSTFGEHYGTINAQNLIKAHAQIESGKAIGKIVLEGFNQ
ncbi:zinc-binding alcohol dehydrogenase family protein [Shewanella sp. M16]|jgi:zinc-binding alcohol dehydrogenase family protein|uniref:zinc-binding alcohol dehydrogenase family protein n=1 Tax=unclassified Shewanella TaxID=196818 RepID=UPI0018E2DB9B|nr:MULTISPECIES: zinc-binding alcohol dehydrogenase family protein [unclassified Shewanella]MBI1675376.1 zinc-binding alcohol dehydrogenase family protein [Shewanella sp. DW31]MBS0044703.1 zinc-binding alcohol dehydrogenase family protein [Shewanella sp. M16]MCU8004708.1 zinc-binding alcohol dehydrogenase family protein [Shewanella sp. SM96]MCU8031837.1 zinc-binding alcohol dehydrogenase family protein [Shewanella sp. SM73]MCU8058112.1 zinc-binding alcohol dehydrogenase family protein [Shewane